MDKCSPHFYFHYHYKNDNYYYSIMYIISRVHAGSGKWNTIAIGELMAELRAELMTELKFHETIVQHVQCIWSLEMVQWAEENTHVHIHVTWNWELNPGQPVTTCTVPYSGSYLTNKHIMRLALSPAWLQAPVSDLQE